MNLFRSRWWGWESLANGYQDGARYVYDADAKWYCSGTGTYDYKGESYHRITRAGTNYTAYTANQARFYC